MEDTRCCGSGTCIINAQGYCWCGQKWDGTRMCFPEKATPQDEEHNDPKTPKPAPSGRPGGE
jgi:hypothetical protein